MKTKWAALILLILRSSPAAAAVWFLPDFDAGLVKRNQHTSQVSFQHKCSDYPKTFAEIPVGNRCDTRRIGELICYDNCRVDTEALCKSQGYTNHCGFGERLNLQDLCPDDSRFGSCCRLCDGFTIDEVPEGYVESEHCDSCTGTRYKIKPAVCEPIYSECKYGPAAGAKSCRSGEIIKYNSCIQCRYECSLVICPVGGECAYEACSGKYCLQQCLAGYLNEEEYWNGN